MKKAICLAILVVSLLVSSCSGATQPQPTYEQVATEKLQMATWAWAEVDLFFGRHTLEEISSNENLRNTLRQSLFPPIDDFCKWAYRAEKPPFYHTEATKAATYWSLAMDEILFILPPDKLADIQKKARAEKMYQLYREHGDETGKSFKNLLSYY